MSRLNDVLDLYYQATGETKSPQDVWAKNTTFEKIAFSRDWAYERFVNWAQKKIAERRATKKNLAWDAEEIRKVFNEAYQLMMSRNQKYWDSWKVMSVQAIASLCEMKLNRIAQLWELEAKTADELIDTLNYMVFALIKHKQYMNTSRQLEMNFKS